MTRRKIVVIILCVILILFCTFLVPWQGEFRLTRGQNDYQAEIFLGHAPVYREPRFEYDEPKIEFILKRMGVSSSNLIPFKHTSVSYKVDISRLVIEVFVLVVLAAMIILIIPGSEQNERQRK